MRERFCQAHLVSLIFHFIFNSLIIMKIIMIIIVIMMIIIIIIIQTSIQTDHVIQARRPDVILIDKEKKECKIIDFAIPYDSRVNAKEMEKIETYQDLAREVQKLWNIRTKVIPIVIGALGTTPKKLSRRLDDLGIGTRIVELQKTVIIYSARDPP